MPHVQLHGLDPSRSTISYLLVLRTFIECHGNAHQSLCTGQEAFHEWTPALSSESIQLIDQVSLVIAYMYESV
jgi:hypothetical protein